VKKSAVFLAENALFFSFGPKLLGYLGMHTSKFCEIFSMTKSANEYGAQRLGVMRLSSGVAWSAFLGVDGIQRSISELDINTLTRRV